MFLTELEGNTFNQEQGAILVDKTVYIWSSIAKSQVSGSAPVKGPNR